MPGIDLKATLEGSRSFFRAHELGLLARELPGSITLTETAQKRVERALAEGFDGAFVFPPVSVQKVHFEEILKQTAASPVFGLPKSEQYTAPSIGDLWALKTAEARNRPLGPYLLLYKTAPFPRETRDKKAPELDRLFDSLGWQGLTVPEYLVLQRLLCEKNKDHRFDLYNQDARRSQWMWLLDSRLSSGVVMAYWNPSGCRVEIGPCKEELKNERRGAHPTVLVTIG